MPDLSADVGIMGHRVQRRIVMALALSAVLPLLALAYVVEAPVMPGTGAGAWGSRSLLLATTLAALAGGWSIWTMGRRVTALAHAAAPDPGGAAGPGHDDLETLAATFADLRATIEQQALEIKRCTDRLDAADRELQTAHARFKEASFKDEVTGLYNRRFFSLRLAEEIARYRRFNHAVSIVLLDLDGFKTVNDDLGHLVGDATLRDVARLLTRHSRGINVVARYGGDEFVVLLVETPKTGARLYANRIRERLSSHTFPHGKPITASFGLASLPDDGAETPEELIRLADEALYVAKRAGKNQVGSKPAVAGVS
jgi:diguanylate cyclase (GGDEF)-like protein